jgi:hypothetical protein
MASNVDFFLVFLVIQISSFEKVLFHLVAHIFIGSLIWREFSFFEQPVYSGYPLSCCRRFQTETEKAPKNSGNKFIKQAGSNSADLSPKAEP